MRQGDSGRDNVGGVEERTGRKERELETYQVTAKRDCRLPQLGVPSFLLQQELVRRSPAGGGKCRWFDVGFGKGPLGSI